MNSQYARLQKWGNSHALRIPKRFIESLQLKENDSIELTQEGDAIQIKKATTTKHRSLEERLTAFYGKPVEEIARIAGDKEYNWGNSVGDEAW